MVRPVTLLLLLAACSSDPAGVDPVGAEDSAVEASHSEPMEAAAAPVREAATQMGTSDAGATDALLEAEAGIPCTQCAYHGVCQTWDYANAAYTGCGAGGRCVSEWAAVVCPAGCDPSIQGSCP
jgi:hypothetical protein